MCRLQVSVVNESESIFSTAPLFPLLLCRQKKLFSDSQLFCNIMVVMQFRYLSPDLFNQSALKLHYNNVKLININLDVMFTYHELVSWSRSVLIKHFCPNLFKLFK